MIVQAREVKAGHTIQVDSFEGPWRTVLKVAKRKTGSLLFTLTREPDGQTTRAAFTPGYGLRIRENI